MTPSTSVFDELLAPLESVPLLGARLAGNSVLAWLTAAVVAVVVFAVLRLAISFVRRRLKRLADRTATIADDLIVEVIGATRRLVVAVVAVVVASRPLELAEVVEKGLHGLLVISLTVQVALWANRAVSFWLTKQKERLAETDPGALTTLQGLSYVVRLVVWSAAFLLMLDNLGYDVTTLVAGLGIGGIAVALAVQNILGDLFASLSIVLDKPFVIGDFIIVGEHQGTVEKVGLKTTRVRSLSGEQLVFSNSDLLGSRIRNFKRMVERRVVFGFGVTYQTPVEQVEAIPGMIREIIEATEKTRFDRAHFKAFGDSSLDFETVYFVLAPEYTLYMDVQQAINLELMRRFEELGIEFAYPTQTLHVAGGTIRTEARTTD